MPELREFVEAVLRDLAQARHAADHYSKHLAQAYQQDEILRQFKVPNLELERVSVDLKFAVKGISKDSQRKEILTSRKDTQIQGMLDRLLQHAAVATHGLAQSDNRYAYAVRRLSDPNVRRELKSRLSRYIVNRAALNEVGGDFVSALVLHTGLPFMVAGVEFFHERDADAELEIRFNVRDSTGKIILSSTRSYPSAQRAVNAAQAALQAGANPANYEVKLAKDKSVYFNLKDDSGVLVARRIEYFEDTKLTQEALDNSLRAFQQHQTPTAANARVAGILSETAAGVAVIGPSLPTTYGNAQFEEAIRPILSEELQVLMPELQRYEAEGQDPVLEVVLGADELRDLPPESISSLSFSTQIRNYVWTQTAESGGNIQRKLIQDPS